MNFSLRSLGKVALALAASLIAVVVLAGYVPHWASSGIVASASGPSGEEFHVVQTYKGMAEPYQVSIFGRKPGQKWTRSYLAHQDGPWSGCRIESDGEMVSVRGGGGKDRTFEIQHFAEDEKRLKEGWSADLTPADLVARHNKIFRDRDLIPLG